MKKIFILLIMLFFVSGCGSIGSRFEFNEKNAPPEAENFNESQVMSDIYSINMGKTPKVKPTGKSAPATDQQSQASGQQSEASQQIQLENLSAEFGSALIKTNKGDIKVSFYPSESPLTVNNFLNLAKKGYYNGTKFHRVIKDFMIQGGDPLSKEEDKSVWGTGGPGYKFEDEINGHKLVKGSLAMANSGANTNGSQFFIVTAESTPWLDGKHTNFGYVTEGMDIVDAIGNVDTDGSDHPIEDVVVEGIELLK